MTNSTYEAYRLAAERVSRDFGAIDRATEALRTVGRYQIPALSFNVNARLMEAMATLDTGVAQLAVRVAEDFQRNYQAMEAVAGRLAEQQAMMDRTVEVIRKSVRIPDISVITPEVLSSMRVDAVHAAAELELDDAELVQESLEEVDEATRDEAETDRPKRTTLQATAALLTILLLIPDPQTRESIEAYVRVVRYLLALIARTLGGGYQPSA